MSAVMTTDLSTPNAANDELTIEMGLVAKKAAPDEARNQRRAAMFLATVNELAIVTQDDYDMAVEELKSLKAAWDDMEADRTSFTKPMNEVLGKLNARFQPHLKTLKSAEEIVKGKISTWLTEQERLANETRQAAERQAEEERERIAREAEVLREQAASTGDMALEAQAIALEQTAEVVIAQPAPVTVYKGAGISTSKTYDFELTSMLELATFIVTKRADLIVLLGIDSVKMRAQVKMMGAKTDLPGVRVFPKTGVTVRG